MIILFTSEKLKIRIIVAFSTVLAYQKQITCNANTGKDPGINCTNSNDSVTLPVKDPGPLEDDTKLNDCDTITISHKKQKSNLPGNTKQRYYRAWKRKEHACYKNTAEKNIRGLEDEDDDVEEVHDYLRKVEQWVIFSYKIKR